MTLYDLLVPAKALRWGRLDLPRMKPPLITVKRSGVYSVEATASWEDRP